MPALAGPPVSAPFSFVLSVSLAAFAGSTCGCNRPDAPRMRELAPAPGKPTGRVIVRSERLGSVPAGGKDSLGRPARVTCVSCHSQRPTASLPESPGELREFHAGMIFEHGELRCSSCHDPVQTHTLRAAHGEPIPASEALALCAQCHGPQARDYRRGSHGGMIGYWDLSRGDRERNHCVDCHDPHAPRYQAGHPVLPPKDRFLSPPHTTTPHASSEELHHD